MNNNGNTASPVRFDHSACSHPRTPKGRAACRKAHATGTVTERPGTITLAGSNVVHLSTDAPREGWTAPLCTGKTPKNPEYALGTDDVTCKRCLALA